MNFKWQMNENKRREFWENYYKSKIDCRVIDLAKKVGFTFYNFSNPFYIHHFPERETAIT